MTGVGLADDVRGEGTDGGDGRIVRLLGGEGGHGWRSLGESEGAQRRGRGNIYWQIFPMLSNHLSAARASADASLA